MALALSRVRIWLLTSGDGHGAGDGDAHGLGEGLACVASAKEKERWGALRITTTVYCFLLCDDQAHRISPLEMGRGLGMETCMEMGWAWPA